MPPINTELDWAGALEDYRYPVCLRDFKGRTRFESRWFDMNMATGNRRETIQFEDHFRIHAFSSMEAWYEVVFWKMYSQGGRADLQVERTIQRITGNSISAGELWSRCVAFIRTESREEFEQFQNLLVKSDSIAVAFTFPAFSCPARFPMVDTRIARYVAAEGSNHGFPTSPAVEKTLNRYRKQDGGVLTLSDWPFVEAWVFWCRELADRLTEERGTEWRARDVEMAVFRAWGDRKERNGLPAGRSRYRLSSDGMAT